MSKSKKRPPLAQLDDLKKVLVLIERHGPPVYQSLAKQQRLNDVYDSKVVIELHWQLNDSKSDYRDRCPQELKTAINGYIEKYQD